MQVGGRETYVPPGSGWENADPNRPVDLGLKTTIFDDQKDTHLSVRGAEVFEASGDRKTT